MTVAQMNAFIEAGKRHYVITYRRNRDDFAFLGSLHVWASDEIELARKVAVSTFSRYTFDPTVIATLKDDTIE